MLVKLDPSSPGRDENQTYLSCHHPDLDVRKQDAEFGKIHTLPNGGLLMVMNPMVQVVINQLKQIQD